MKVLKKIKSILIALRYMFYRYVRHWYIAPFRTYYNLAVEAVNSSEMSFFGYYNVSPENGYENVLFCTPSDTDSKIINLQYTRHSKCMLIGQTKAYNLQQGCMSQWGYANTKNVYYNTYNENDCKYNGVLYNIDTNKVIRTFDLPFYSISKNEEYALSLNFERLAIMRPDYGYFCRTRVAIPADEYDGIWKINLSTNETKLIITLQQLKEFNTVPSMNGAKHKVNHIDISPNGRRFMFLHRWIGPQGRFMRLITADSDGSNLYILNGDKMTSHSFWMDNVHIVSYCYTEEFGEAYTVFQDKSKLHYVLSDKLPKRDGHPSTSRSGEWMIMDTYPGLDRMSRLYLYNIQKDVLYCIGRFYQPRQYHGTARIDLHPKWNMEGNKIYFESGHNGYRKLYYIDVSSIVEI